MAVPGAPDRGHVSTCSPAPGEQPGPLPCPHPGSEPRSLCPSRTPRLLRRVGGQETDSLLEAWSPMGQGPCVSLRKSHLPSQPMKAVGWGWWRLQRGQTCTLSLPSPWALGEQADCPQGCPAGSMRTSSSVTSVTHPAVCAVVLKHGPRA